MVCCLSRPTAKDWGHFRTVELIYSNSAGAFSRTTLIFFLTVFVSVNSVVFIPTLIEDRTVR